VGDGLCERLAEGCGFHPQLSVVQKLVSRAGAYVLV